MFLSRSIFGIFASTLTLTALASPTPTSVEPQALAKRGAVLTAQYATETEPGGRYVLANNLWGLFGDPSGHQSTQVTALNGDDVTWTTAYQWGGSNIQVKSYANIDMRINLSKSLSQITSIPTHWSWTYTNASSNLVADVSYDLWLSTVPNSTGATSSSSFEIMIWLSDRGGINGVTWKLWKGTVGSWTVFSYVAPTETTNFVADLKPFFTYLTTSQGVSSSQLLVQAQSGTEPFVGSATLTTNSYSLAIN